MKYILISGLLLSLNANGQKDLKFTEYDLDNGMHVILHEDHSTPVVAVTMLYHVGSKNENPERTGFAHFFEHLLFEGSANIDRHQFDKYVENAGGTLNANTSQDRTFYYVLMPSNQLELGLWLESERLLHAKVEDIGIETQREVVKEEKRQRVDNVPYGTMREHIFSRAFDQHPYQWQPIGSMEHLNAAEENDYVNFYKNYYVPNNVTLSIAGDINIEQAKELIKKYMATVPAGEKLSVYRDLMRLSSDDFINQYCTDQTERAMWKTAIDSMHPMMFLDTYMSDLSDEPIPVVQPEVVEPALSSEIRDTIYDNIQLPAVIQAYRIPAQGTPDYYALDMLNSLLTNGQSSRMHKQIVDKDLKALFVGAFAYPLEDPGVNISFALCNSNVEPQDLEMAMNKEIDRVQNELITEREYQKLINQFENNFLSANSTMAGIAESLAQYHTYFGDANLINTELEKYQSVTREDIQRVAKKYLVPSNRITLYYLPKTN